MSLRVGVCGTLLKFEILLENKHMDTNELCDKSTDNADNEAELRTMSGQGFNQGEQVVTGKVWKAVQFRSRDEAIQSLCRVVFGADPVFPDTPAPSPANGYGGQVERIRVAAYTEPQIQAFCRSHMIPRRNVARIRTVRDLHGWRPGLLLLLPSWWLGTDSDTVPFARERGWTIAEVTEEEVLNGPTPPAERPTPESDEAWGRFVGKGDATMLYQRMQKLERERDEARKSAVCIHDGTAASAHGWALKFSEAKQQCDRLAEALRDLLAEYDDRKNQFGDSPLWIKHEEVEVIEECHAMLAEMRAVKETPNTPVQPPQ